MNPFSELCFQYFACHGAGSCLCFLDRHDTLWPVTVASDGSFHQMHLVNSGQVWFL